MPNSIVEAFAAGVPVDNVPVEFHIVTHDRTGLMVDCDDHRALAARRFGCWPTRRSPNVWREMRERRAGEIHVGGRSPRLATSMGSRPFAGVSRQSPFFPDVRDRHAEEAARPQRRRFRERVCNLVVFGWNVSHSPEHRQPSDAKFWRRLAPATRARAVLVTARRCSRNSAHRAPTVLLGFADREATLETLSAGWPSAPYRLRRADRIRAGVRLADKDLSFGEPVDWHREPVAKRTAPITTGSHSVPRRDHRRRSQSHLGVESSSVFPYAGSPYWLTGDEACSRHHDASGVMDGRESAEDRRKLGE